ncbi:hypothetical protein ACOSP7_016139 [Xanthoceras sorbifolium]
MESHDVVQFLKDKTILITGGTGFLAKIFLEKILRIQPNVKKIYLLMRAGDTNSATQRMLKEFVEKEVSRVLRNIWGANLHSFILGKVVAVPGDVSYDNMGVRDCNLREEMCREIDIIFNVAATTNFDERYDVALGTNTMGAFHALSFAKKCVKVKMFFHVSTAYVCGERSGVIAEKPFYMGESLEGTYKLDITAEKKLVQETLNELEAQHVTKEVITSTMKDLGTKRARLYGWPNTYVFTKAMGEMMLGYYKENLSLVIIRPTMITSTYQEPFPGWIEGLRTIDGTIFGFAKGKLKCLPGKHDAIVDLIPADMVVNAMLMGMAACGNQNSCEEIIYHIGSSMRNPVTSSNIQEFSYHYFTKYPYINKNGKAAKVRKITVLDTSAKFRRYIAIRYVLPLKVLQIMNWILCQCFKNICIDYQRKIKFVMRLVELYKPYLFFNAIFEDTNTENLRMTMRESDMEMDGFNFDPKCIDWEDYIMYTHIPGLLKYAVK